METIILAMAMSTTNLGLESVKCKLVNHPRYTHKCAGYDRGDAQPEGYCTFYQYQFLLNKQTGKYTRLPRITHPMVLPCGHKPK